MNDIEPVTGQQGMEIDIFEKKSVSDGRRRNGGRRPGAGRPKGKMDLATRERLAIRKRFEDRIHNNADRLLNAALTKALGESYLMHKYTIGTGSKARTQIDIVTDPNVIIDYLNDELNQADDDDYYYISTKPVDMVAIKELYDRAFGKALQRNELTGKDGEPLTAPISAEQAEQLLKLRSKRASA